MFNPLQNNIQGVLLYDAQIEKNPSWSYRVTKGGAILAKGIHNDIEELVCWIPRDVVEEMNEYSDIFDYIVSDGGWVAGRLKK